MTSSFSRRRPFIYFFQLLNRQRFPKGGHHSALVAQKHYWTVTDAGYKELDLLHGLSPRVLRGAPRTAAYSVVGDDMGRIDLPPMSAPLRVGQAVEVIPAHCWLTVPSFSRYHVVRGDDLVDIWPVIARDDR